ncbi:transposase [Streptomyces sp. SDT5-1]|uniref:transposase n=1 Tax=Streptomyces sp. SDT5-1 TaxID=3406418 RepID=UPI003FCFC117
MGVMTGPWIVDDDLWAVIEPLLPPWPERSPGLRPVADRLCLQGILYVLHQDIAGQLLPLELRFGSGQTCWRRLDRWQQAGAFQQLHRTLLAKLNAAPAASQAKLADTFHSWWPGAMCARAGVGRLRAEEGHDRRPLGCQRG